jgi:hypothetical protein
MQEEGWVVCRAFKKRTAYPVRSMALAWDPSFAYRDPNVMVDPNAAYGQIRQQSKNARFKQEAGMDGAAAAFLQYSASHLVELPQLESPSALLAPNASQASTEEDGTGGGGRRRGKKARTDKVSTDWRALDKFVASQLSPTEGGGGMEATAPSATGVSSQLDHHCTEDDMAALLFLNSDGREEVERWAGLLSPAGGDSDLGICARL